MSEGKGPALGSGFGEKAVEDDKAEDIDFQRALQRIEAQAQGRGGWLVARGAYDRGDSVYLREEEERRRHAEEIQWDKERYEFEMARARADQIEEKFRSSLEYKKKKDSTDAQYKSKQLSKATETRNSRKAFPKPVVLPITKTLTKKKRNISELESKIENREDTGLEKEQKLDRSQMPSALQEDYEGDNQQGHEISSPGLPGLLCDYGSDEDLKIDDSKNDHQEGKSHDKGNIDRERNMVETSDDYGVGQSSNLPSAAALLG